MFKQKRICKTEKNSNVLLAEGAYANRGTYISRGTNCKISSYPRVLRQEWLWFYGIWKKFISSFIFF